MDIYCDFRARSIASLHVQTGQATNKAPIFDFISKKTRFIAKKGLSAYTRIVATNFLSSKDKGCIYLILLFCNTFTFALTPKTQEGPTQSLESALD